MEKEPPKTLEEHVRSLSSRLLVKSYVIQRKNKPQECREFHEEVYARILARSGIDIADLWHVREQWWLDGTEDDAMFTEWSLFYLGESAEPPRTRESENPGDMSFVTDDPSFGFGTLF